jgi:heterodisulfide reductase subunit A
MSKDKIGAALIIGGGIAGMQASLDLADSGFKIYIVDKSPSIGGAMAQLDKTFPTNDCAMCIMAPKLVETGRHHNITLITNAEIEKVDGEAGHFTVTVSKRPRFVDESKCTGCGICTQRCPIEIKDDYNRGFKKRKAIHIKYPQAVPPIHCIDQEVCIGCGICETQCEAGAITYSQEVEQIVLEVGSIIVSPGFEEFDLSTTRKEYGYSVYPNVISSLELERMLSATGPYNGMVLRPSDGELAQKIAFIQCVGSRDKHHGNPYCSSVCCMFAIKEAVIAQEHTPGLKTHIFFMDLRAFGKEFDDYYGRAENEHGVKFTRNNRISRITEDPETNNLRLHYIDGENIVEEEFDMVVLAVGMSPPKDAEELAAKLGIELNQFNFCSTELIFSPLETSKPGIYVCGAFGYPKDIPDTVSDASGAATKVASLIASERNTLVTKKVVPEEIEISPDEEARIGVFICQCGINIGGVVDVPKVVEYEKTLPNVVYAEHNLYTCSQDTQEKIKGKIKEHNLNRVIVASCTPRTHGPLFMNTVREVGLNPFLFEMANIRDQCSWVHMHNPEKATQKAKELVRMAVAKARLLEPMHKIQIPVTPSALIIGGGVTGMTAALEIAKQGFDAYLVEKEPELGGLMQRVYYDLSPDGNGRIEVQDRLKKLKEELNNNKKTHIFTNSTIKNINGYVGNFKTIIDQNDSEIEIDHGVIIVATGGIEYKPTEYLYGQNKNVMTQLELEEKLGKEGKIDAETVVMIHCVGCRNEERTYCSRVCCSETIKNALLIKKLKPESKIYVLFRDMRTYGFSELYYEEAARSGVTFIRYNKDEPPVVNDDNGLKVKIKETLLNSELVIEPDIIALAAATLPQPGNSELAQMLKVPLSKDKFFLEAHMKLRPVEFSTEGIFLCGLAHSPKFFEECIAQANAAVSRAGTILSLSNIESEGLTSRVNTELCSGCKTCTVVCPQGAVTINEDGLADVLEVLCKGCGICAASCPEKALSIVQFTDEQLLAQVEAAIKDPVIITPNKEIGAVAQEVGK